MRVLRVTLAAMLLLSLSTGVWAQETPAAAKVESVLTHVPAGAMGFAVVKNVKALGANIDGFLKTIGVAQQLQIDTIPNGSVGMMQMAAQLGQGFNPDGGFAVIMLDPQAYGIDLAAAMEAGQPPKELPFVILAPGTGVAETFGAYKQEPAGNYTKVSLRMGDMLATQLGGYIALSPMAKALDAMAKPAKTADITLSKAVLKSIDTDDLVVYVNMEVAGPLYVKIIEKAAQQMSQQGPGMPLAAAGVMDIYTKALIPMYKRVIPQMESIWFTARLANTGLVLSENFIWKADSEMAKMLAGVKGVKGDLVGRLPNLPYGLAMGQIGNASKEGAAFAQGMFKDILATKAFDQMAEADKTKALNLMAELNDQTQEMQLVVGGAPASGGVFGAAMVLKVKDAAKAKTALVDTVKFTLDTVKAMANEPEVSALAINHEAGVETINGLKVDAFTISHPEMANISDADRAEMVKALGEDKLRVLMAQPDAQTLVLTFGGAAGMMDEAIKAAKSGGGIMDENAKAALKELPGEPLGIVLVNGANIFSTVLKGMQTINPQAPLPPIQITAKTPIAVAAFCEGNVQRVGLFIPSDLVREVVNIGMMFAMPRAGPGAPPPGGEF